MTTGCFCTSMCCTYLSNAVVLISVIVYDVAHRLLIVCLIYCERLMENAHVPLVTQTWRPVLLCCLLLASKVWQDQGTWNIDMADIFPQYSLQNINKLERTFCAEINWDLYISPSVYAKYYFALRSITAEKDFRRNYNMMIHIPVPGAEMVANRSEDLRSHVLAKSL